jgi:DNA invertase Pin-like site-specific DNA recombinase
MNQLARFGLTKESMQRMLGPVTATAKKQEIPPGPNRKWYTVPDDIKTAILKAHPTYTYRELAKKYGVSLTSVWKIKNQNQNNKK